MAILFEELPLRFQVLDHDETDLTDYEADRMECFVCDLWDSLSAILANGLAAGACPVDLELRVRVYLGGTVVFENKQYDKERRV